MPNITRKESDKQPHTFFFSTLTCSSSIDCSTWDTNKASWQSTRSSVPAVSWMVSNLILPKPWLVDCYEVLFGGPRLHPCNHGWRWWGECWDFSVGFPERWQTLEPFQYFVEQSVHILCKRREHCNIHLYITSQGMCCSLEGKSKWALSQSAFLQLS